MKYNNLFSVIIPTYKRVFEVKKAIDSVISQTINNWEIIVVDNNSKDGTINLIKSYNNEKIKLFFINNNGNIAKSRNLGIKKSSGNYLAFLDSDDVWKSNKLEECQKILNKNIKLVYHDMYIKRKVGNFLSKKTGYCRTLKKPIYKDMILNGPAFPTSSVVVEKKILKKINYFNENKELITWEDYDAWIRLSKISESFFEIKKTLGYLYIGKENNLRPNNQIANIYAFKKKYLSKNDIFFPNWCNFALMRSLIKIKKFDQSLNFFKKIKINKFSFFQKIKIFVFYIIIKLKISI